MAHRGFSSLILVLMGAVCCTDSLERTRLVPEMPRQQQRNDDLQFYIDPTANKYNKNTIQPTVYKNAQFGLYRKQPYSPQEYKHKELSIPTEFNLASYLDQTEYNGFTIWPKLKFQWDMLPLPGYNAPKRTMTRDEEITGCKKSRHIVANFVPLGEGNFSNVFLCVRWVKRYIGAADGTITDIMRYHFDVKVLKLYKRNFNFMNSLKLVKDNPKISKYFPQITEIYPNKNMYEMEYTYGVTLENLVTSATKIHPSLLSKIFSDLEAAITDLLNQGFFVCDINPGNIIIDFVSGKVHFLDVDETAFYYAHKSVMNVNIKYSTESMLNTFKMSANDYEEILHKIKSEMDIITDKFSKIDTVEDLQAHLLPQSQYLQFYDLLITSSSTLQEDITFKAPEAAVYAVAYQSENGTNTLFTMVHDDNVSLGRQFKFAILDLITEDELFTEAYGYGEIVFQSIKGRQLIHKLWEDEPRLIVEDNNDELEEKRQQRLYSKFRAKPDNSSEEEANTKSDDSSSDELAYLVNLEKTKFDSLLSKLGSTFDKEERQLIIKLNNAHHVGLVLQATGYSQKDVEQAMYKAQNYFEIAQSILRGEPIQSEYHIKRGSILIISDDNLGKPNQPVSDSEEI